nr:GNAT family N-acetyltransferase [Kushneria phosphatilytica]
MWHVSWSPPISGVGAWGKELCRRLIHEAQARMGAQRITLNVYHDNHAARRLYHRLGFTESGTINERGVQPMILFPDEMP